MKKCMISLIVSALIVLCAVTSAFAGDSEKGSDEIDGLTVLDGSYSRRC